MISGFHRLGEEGELCMSTNRYKASFEGDKNVLKLDSSNANSINTLKTTKFYTLKE